MKRYSTGSNRYQRGFSLAEVLTATAIFAIIFIAALMIYDRSNRVYKQGVEAADMQQSTRVAFDKLVADLRLTGFDFDRDGTPSSTLASTWQASSPYSIGNMIEPTAPNGVVYRCVQGGTSGAAEPAWDPAIGTATNEVGGSTVQWQAMHPVQYQQPDEQVEFAGTSLVGIRANFDYDFETGPCSGAIGDPCENGRETAYESDSFPIVTTGNDEIVLYALRPVAGGTFPQQTFYADMAKPRNVNTGTRRAETKVDLPTTYDPCAGGTCDNPPYTLYRISFKDANGAQIVETPIAENIRSMQIRYFRDAAATDEILPADLPNGLGQWNGAAPDETVEERDLRGEMRAIRVNLVGMNPQPDGSYTDPTDAIKPQHRKYQLETLIVPRNIGRHGMREFNTNTPAPPVLENVCAGSCNAVYLNWTAASTGGSVESYNILYDRGANKCVGGVVVNLTFAEDAGQNLEGYASMWVEPGEDWHFAVQAINRSGATTSNCMTVRVENKTQPEAPVSLQASGDGTRPEEPNKISLFWPPVTTNSDAFKTVTCSGGGQRDTKVMPNAERRYYRVYRSTNAAVDPADAATKVVLSPSSPNQPLAQGAELVWADTATANCLTYYYRIETLDHCWQNASWNQGGDITRARSATYFPPLGTDGIAGRASEMATPPAAPQGFSVAGSNCSAGICDVTLAWSAVTKDNPADPNVNLIIDEYVITHEINSGLGYVAAVPGTHSVKGGLLTFTIPNVVDTVENRFYVQARDCIDGDKAGPIYFPCTFSGGVVTIMPDVFWDGSGTAGDPWVTQAPASILVGTENPVTTIEASFSQGGLPIGTSFVATGPINSASIPIPDLAEGEPALVSVTVTDDSAGGCTFRYEYYVIDQPTPDCALRDRQLDASVVVWPSGGNDRIVTVKLENTSVTVGDDFNIQRVFVRWTRGTGNRQADRLESAVFPTGTVTTNCDSGNTEFDVDALPGELILQATGSGTPPAGSSRTFTLNFRRARAQAINTNPVASVCVVYRTNTGDVLSCQISPSAGDCTTTGTDCY